MKKKYGVENLQHNAGLQIIKTENSGVSKQESPIRVFTPATRTATDYMAYYMFALSIPQPTAKKIALFTVNQIINANPHGNPLNSTAESTMKFWLEVKSEIERM